MGQIPLADCSVLGRCDESVTGRSEKARRWAGLLLSQLLADQRSQEGRQIRLLSPEPG